MGVKPASEGAFQAAVLELARLCGWLVYHTRDSRRSARGLPDLVLVRERVVWAELKAEAGDLTPDQKRWLAALEAAGAEVYVWRPEDWPQIERVLQRR